VCTGWQRRRAQLLDTLAKRGCACCRCKQFCLYMKLAHCLHLCHSKGLLADSCLTWQLGKLRLRFSPRQSQTMLFRAGAPKALAAPPPSGVFLLLVLNLAAFVADHLLHLPFMPLLYLNHQAPHW